MRRVGKNPDDAITVRPAIERAVQQLSKDWSVGEISDQGSLTNQILRLSDGRELLILAGRSSGHCGGLANAVVYDLTSGYAANGTFEIDMNEPVPDEPSNFLVFNTGKLTPENEIIAILWESLQRVEPGDVSYNCYGNDNEE